MAPGHGFVRFENRITAYRAVVDWFARYL